MTEQLGRATLMFLLRGDEIMLAMKKRGFGANKPNGPGGKYDPTKDKDISDTAIRETEEEIGVIPVGAKLVAVLSFYFPNTNFGKEVWVYTSENWEGEPVESEEMKPKWYNRAEIPFDQMWPDEAIWLPRILAGAMLRGEFMFGENDKIEEYHLDEVEKLE